MYQCAMDDLGWHLFKDNHFALRIGAFRIKTLLPLLPSLLLTRLNPYRRL